MNTRSRAERSHRVGSGILFQLSELKLSTAYLSHADTVYVRHTPEQQVCILNTTYKRQISDDRIEFELFPRPRSLVVGVSVSCIQSGLYTVDLQYLLHACTRPVWCCQFIALSTRHDRRWGTRKKAARWGKTCRKERRESMCTFPHTKGKAGRWGQDTLIIWKFT